MEPLTILASLIPFGIDLGKTLISKYISPTFVPATISDWVTMQKQDIEKYLAINSAGGNNVSYLWVEAIVRLQRHAVAFVTLGIWAYSHTVGTPSDSINNSASSIWFYLFGDRTLTYIKGK